VSASRFESFGVAIAEALACGLPVVSTDSGGPADFIGDQDGTLVPLEDSGGLRYSIVSMMEKFRSFDREAMRARVVERFSSSAVRTQIESVYASVKKTT
ncbi:MAG: glycosyltransferase, partial [Bacteroidota bacterium]